MEIMATVMVVMVSSSSACGFHESPGPGSLEVGAGSGERGQLHTDPRPGASKVCPAQVQTGLSVDLPNGD